MAIAPVQAIKYSNNSNYNSRTLVLDSLPTTGNTLIVTFGTSSSASDLANVTGGGVTTWVKDVESTVRRSCSIWRGTVDTTPSATVTLSTPSASPEAGSSLSEWPPLALQASGGTAVNDGQSATPSTGSVTPTAAVECLLIGVVGLQNVSTSDLNNSFTALTPSASRGPSGYRNVASPSGSYSAASSMASSFAVWDGAIAVYYEPAPPPNAKIGTFIESFNGGSLPSTLSAVQSGGVISFPAGTMEIDGGDAGGESAYVESIDYYDLEDSTLFWQAVIEAGVSFEAGVYDAAGDGYYIFALPGGNYRIQRIVAWATTDVYTVAYNATDHYRMRVREAGGTIYFETAALADGDTWTTEFSEATNTNASFDPSAVRFYIAGLYSSVANATVTVPGINVSVAPTPVSRGIHAL